MEHIPVPKARAQKPNFFIREGIEKMSDARKMVVVFIWITAILCCYIMKKIRPGRYKLYFAWVAFVTILFTVSANILQ